MNPVLAAIAYFDLFDYPLTAAEAHQYAASGSRGTLADTMRTLDELRDRALIESHDGCYMLAGRRDIAATRARRYAGADRKIKLALRGARWFARIPFITSVSLCNNLGFFNARSEADIDLFITVRRGRIFFVRFFVVALAQLLGLRISDAHIADRLCLSFYAAEDGFDFSGLRLGDDVYLRYWVATVWPVWTAGGYEAWRRANPWADAPGGTDRLTAYHRRISPQTGSLVRRIGEALLRGRLGDGIERLLRSLQLRTMHRDKRDRAAAGDGGVVISDRILKFHLDDRRRALAAAYADHIHSLAARA